MNEKKNLNDVNLERKKVLVRVDYNVPMDENGNITDDTRIRATLPTIEYLMNKNSKIILASHLGRPKGEVNEKYSLKPVAKRLSEILGGKKVLMANDCIGSEVKEMVDILNEEDILLLENLRFHKEEEKNDPEFSKQLASIAEVLVNDAFGVSHRAHASVEGVTKFIPAVSGFLIDKELSFLMKAVYKPERPLVAIIGGAKVSDKIGVLENLLNKADALLIGGGMANTFIKALGYEMGKSLVEEGKVDLAKEIIAEAKQKNVKLVLPVDVVVAEDFKADAKYKTVKDDEIPVDWTVLDIGKQTVQDFTEVIKNAKTIVWNGPMGVAEFDNFAHGTEEVAKAVAKSGAQSIVGGGDSIAALNRLGLADNITHISTGGGASLEFLEGKDLPGIAALADK